MFNHNSMHKHLIVLLILFFLSSCGTENGAGTGVSNPPSTTTKAAAVIAAVFSTTDSNANINASMLVTPLSHQRLYQVDSEGVPCAENDPACTCSDSDTGGSNIAIQQFGMPGTYGSVAYPFTVSTTDFCELENGTDNSGDGADGDGLVNTFTILNDIPVNCDGETAEFSMGADSTGIYRNTTAEQTGTSYWPQIFGAFIFNVDGSEVLVDCTIFLAEDQTIEFADCSDTNGNSIDLDSDTNCTIESGEE